MARCLARVSTGRGRRGCEKIARKAAKARWEKKRLAYGFEVVGLIGFHALQGSNYGRIGRAGLYTTIGAIVVWEFLILTSLFGGNEGLPEWLWP